MTPTLRDYELIIFDFAPKLKVVGGYHALNDDDRKILDGVVGESDFVALEYDHTRKDNQSRFEVEVDPHQESVLCQGNTIYANPENAAYFTLLMSLHSGALEAVNQQLANGRAVRNTNENEIAYCLEAANRLGKSVHLVDMPFPELLSRLSRLSLATKIDHLCSALNVRENPPEVDRILLMEREDYMLADIARKEGCPLEALTRRGVLVTGATHAKNLYERRMHV